MTGKVHAGITGIAMYSMQLDITNKMSWWFIGGGIIGSFLPDADIKGAPASILPLWIWWKHRTYTHSFLGLAVVTGLSYFISVPFGLGIFLGYALHLYFDSLTRMGLPYLYYFPTTKMD